MKDSLRTEGDERLDESATQPLHASEAEIGRQARTDRFISDMLIALTGVHSHEAAMNDMLNMMSTILNPDRLSIFECGGDDTTNTFELCAEGIEPQLGSVHELPSWAIKKWFSRIEGKPVALIPDISVIQEFSEPLYNWCVENDVQRFMAAPFYNEGETVGFLGAYNYNINEDIDVNRIFAAVSSFIGARIENRRLIEDLDWAGKHDYLTKLLNRRGYEDAATEFLSKHPDEPYTLVLIDLDDFKKANDLYGHLTGDNALRAMGKKMQETFPGNAILSRNGGDEFLAIIPGKKTEATDKLIEQFANDGVNYEHDGKTHRLSMSIGYACFPEHAGDYEMLHTKADTALYAVKLADKSEARKYSPELDLQYRTRLGFSPHDIAENITCGIAIFSADSKGELLFINDEMLRLTECAAAPDFLDYSHEVIWNILHADDYKRVSDKLINQAKRNDFNEIPSGDFHIITKAGAVKHVLGSSRMVELDEIGKIFYTILIELKQQ